MEVRAGRQAAVADRGDRLATRHVLADVHEDTREVRVLGLDAVAVIDLEHETVSGLLRHTLDDRLPDSGWAIIRATLVL